MVWIKERKGARGTSFTGCYRDTEGRERSAGSFSTRRAAERAAQREEQKVLAGAWQPSLDARRTDLPCCVSAGSTEFVPLELISTPQRRRKAPASPK